MSTEVGRKNNGRATGTRATPADITYCVRYGFSTEGGGTRQEGILRSIYEPIPEGAFTVSPVYLVPTDRYEHQFELEHPAAIKGDASYIAKEIQDECEEDQKVWYPVHVESDAKISPHRMIPPLVRFVSDVLGVAPSECSFYYSGRRSIHVHVPRFVKGENDREALEERAKEWNEQADILVDVGIYSRKRQFRIPGVEHAKTGFRKVPIETDWDLTQIVRAANGAGPEEVPETYDDVLKTVFGSGLTTLLRREAARDGDELFLRFTRKKHDVKLPIEEQVAYPAHDAEVWRWHAYNDPEFSPYRKTEGDRSVCAVKIVGTPFGREDFGKGKTLVPARFYGAVGRDGNYTKEAARHAPLLLSDKDYEKYEKQEHGPGDSLVIIGGQSRSSRIIRVSQAVAETVGNLLVETEQETGRRQSTFDYLIDKGHDVGKAGYNGQKNNTSGKNGTQREWPAKHIRPALNPDSPAGKLQQRVEQNPGAIKKIIHDERFSIACRLLRIGTWDAAWEWFSQQFGKDFDPAVTYTQLTNTFNSYPHHYTHIEIPPPPSTSLRE